MTFRVVQRARARQDILELVEHIAADNPRAAAAFYDAYERTLTGLEQMPDKGRPYRSKEPWLRGVRAISVGRFRRYLSFYRRTGNQVDVLRVLHGARDIDTILNREEA